MPAGLGVGHGGVWVATRMLIYRKRNKSACIPAILPTRLAIQKSLLSYEVLSSEEELPCRAFHPPGTLGARSSLLLFFSSSSSSSSSLLQLLDPLFIFSPNYPHISIRVNHPPFLTSPPPKLINWPQIGSITPHRSNSNPLLQPASWTGRESLLLELSLAFSPVSSLPHQPRRRFLRDGGNN